MEKTGLVEGDRIRLELNYGRTKDFVVEQYRDCLGVFISPEDRTAGKFTPLCEMYGRGPESEDKYLSNYGEYITNQVPIWMQLPKAGGKP
ncbi:hypothetical protein [Cohaesibacter celericrescens]|uniref:hypothetical protein n=1 Tax=Cohaesibacter celericrescens TaxID=2067669 RepID=UPI003564C02A